MPGLVLEEADPFLEFRFLGWVLDGGELLEVVAKLRAVRSRLRDEVVGENSGGEGESGGASASLEDLEADDVEASSELLLLRG